MKRFEGKVIVVTGGSSGIGLALAQRIVAEGGKVLVTGTSTEKLKAASALHHDIHTIENDAADPLAARILATEAKRLFGEIDGAFLNAGIGGVVPLDKVTPEFFHRMFNLNVAGPLFGAQALVPLMKSGSSILITSSAAKDKGFPGAAIYSASKGAVRSMVKGLARELASKAIRVNSVSPGPTETTFFERAGRPKEQLDAFAKYIASTNPLGRMGRAEEAAAVAAFLLSDEASYVTGSDYAVDGGEAQL
jgi:NAD(P)-dependent dehydrogenase (short-subunit alcohol dehydrogenase family)